MKTIPIAVEKQRIIDHLRSGWKLYLIEDRPYPNPHIVMLVREQEQNLVSYSAFVSLNASNALTLVETTTFEGKPARVYALAE